MPFSRSSAVSFAILGILAAIGTGVFHQQSSFNPAVKVLSESTGPARPGAADGASDTAGSKSLTAKGTDVIIRLPEALSPLSPAEHFDAVTLSDKIDGKAELYLPSGFKSMDCQRFKARNSEIWLETFIYDMGAPENAFSVFSRQRRDDVTLLDLTPYAYKTENAIFLTQGRFYVEMIASAPEAAAVEWMVELARTFIEDHPEVAPKKLAVPDLFPPASDAGHLMPDKESITLITTDAFGFDRFDQVYTVGYHVNGTAVSAFISQRGSEAEAEKLAAEYTGFLKTFGGSAVDVPADLLKADEKNGMIIHAVTIMDTVEIVFSVGPFLAGVREAEDIRSAQALASALMTSLLAARTDPP